MGDLDKRIGTTHVMKAIARAEFTDMPYAREIYDVLRIVPGVYHPPNWFHSMKSMASKSKFVLVRATSLEGKYLSTNYAKDTKLGDCCVIEMMMGLGQRGLVFTNDSTSLFIEGDTQRMIDTKEKIVEAVRANEGSRVHPYHKFVKLDPLNIDDFINAGEMFRDFGNGKPVALLTEGIFTRMPHDAQEKFRDNIVYFLKNYSPDGAWITPDFSYKAKESNRFIKRIISYQNKNVKANHFKQDKTEQFLNDGGLRSELLPNDHIVPAITMIDKMGLNIDRVRKIAEGYQVRYITLK